MASVIPLIYDAISSVIQIFRILLFVYILMSWVPASRNTKFGELLGKITEPYLGVFRKVIPPLGMIDISPIVAILALNFINEGIRLVLSMIQSSLM